MFYIFEEHIKIKIFEKKLGEISISQDEKIYIHSLAKSITHHKLMDFVLSELKEEHKRDFAKHIKAKTPSLKVHKFLHKNIRDYRAKLLDQLSTIEKELIESLIK
ncbi:hypothetical protein KA001_02570 [Patescibacteria group bacterium]|nr:hypothetical protein [Patescibacteria group bacterium]